jgi:hypothetical protein
MADRSEWARRVSEWRRSGLTAAEYCRGRDFAVSTLRWYSSQLGEIDEVDETPEPAFAKIGIRCTNRCSDQPPHRSRSTAWPIDPSGRAESPSGGVAG